MSRLPILAAVCLVLLTTTMPATAADLSPRPITPDLHCPTCGMMPARYPEWQNQVIFKDGTMAAFDGGKCLFRFLLGMGNFEESHTAAEVAAIWVKDYETGSWIDAKNALFVAGSNEMGPMGKEIIPFAAREQAQKFQKSHGGDLLLFNEIKPHVVKPLMGGMHHMKKMQMHH